MLMKLLLHLLAPRPAVLFSCLWILASGFCNAAALSGNTITADGTYTLTTFPGKKYVFAAGGTFGSGSLALNWHDQSGNTGAIAGSPSTAAETYTFTAPTNQVDLVLTGSTAATISISIALATGDPVTTFNYGTTLDPRNSVTVAAGDTDNARGTALLAAYTAAKLLTPNGAALSANNRAQVIIPPGKYKLTATLILDTDFVDLVALVPQKGGAILETDLFPTVGDAPDVGIDLQYFRPPPTLVYTEVPLIDTVLQTCDDLRLTGFGIAQLGVWEPNDIPTLNFRIRGAFSLDNIENAASLYDTMYFFCRMTENGLSGGVATLRDFYGTWRNCIASANSWTIGKGFYADSINGSSDYEQGKFYGVFYDCQGGPQSFIGDTLEHPASGAFGAKFYRCISYGQGGFGGCGLSGTPIDADCYFEDCVTGANGYGLGKTVAGTFVRCRGGSTSFAGNGVFSGTATDCEGGGGSFGGQDSINDAYALGTAKCTGTLIRCKTEGSTRPMVVAGATIRDCRITCTTTGQHGVQLFGATAASITNTEIIVVQGGTGVPIYAATALNVIAASCRMNNATNDVDGLSLNATNLVLTAGNVVSNSIR